MKDEMTKKIIAAIAPAVENAYLTGVEEVLEALEEFIKRLREVNKSTKGKITADFLRRMGQ